MKLTVLAWLAVAAPLFAQSPAAAPTTAVLVGLTVKPGIERAEITKIMPEEIRATVKLYLEGKIQQWYSRGDGKGVVFIMNCATVAEAKSLMEPLPLFKANLVVLEYTPLSPLTPLRFLMGSG